MAPRPARLCSGIPERHVCPHGSRFLAAPLQCGVCVPGRGQSVCQLSALPFNSCRHPGAGWRRVASPELCAVCPVWPHEGQRPPHTCIGVIPVVVLVTPSCPTLVTPWTVTHQAPLSMGFPRREYRDGLPLPSPGNLPDPESNPGLLHRKWILYR